jgi:hypothetical protein
VAEQLRLALLGASDRLFGLELEHLAVDGCITKAPCGGQPPRRRAAGRHLERHRAARPVVHLDTGYDYQPCRHVLSERGMAGEIATRGVQAPIQASRRWPVERTHAWGNQYGKLRWCTERRRVVVEFWLSLASAAIVLGRLVRRAWSCYRWDSRPHRRP